MLSFPSFDAIASLVLLAHVEFGNDSESGLWMMSGMAVRMAQDLGLHLVRCLLFARSRFWSCPGWWTGYFQTQGNEDVSPEERRRNRLLFWAVLILDHTVSFGTGRVTTFRMEQIKVDVPHEDDLPDRSPFRHAANLMHLYGPLINLLNGERDEPELLQKLSKVKRSFIHAYQSLPSDMVWHVTKYI
jgi:hypothetical protein